MGFDRSWRLSGKEKRYQRDVNHVVSKRIVAFAARYPKAVIVLEDLRNSAESQTAGGAERRRPLRLKAGGVDSAPGNGTPLEGWVSLLEAAE